MFCTIGRVEMDDSDILKASLNASQLKCGYCRAQFAFIDDPKAPLKPLMKCAGCLMAYYCSKEHQRMDWKRHKILCKTIQAKLSAIAAAEAEAQLSHGAPVIPTPSTELLGELGRRRYGSNTQLCMDQRDQQLRQAELASVNLNVESCRSSATGSPPTDTGGGSASSSVHGSMADLIASTPYHTSKGGRYSVNQTVGNPKRARFPLTVIRERRSSIGSGEAARLAAAAAAATGKPPPDRDESGSDDDDMDYTFTPEALVAGGRKRAAAGTNRPHPTNLGPRAHVVADRCASDAEANAARLQNIMIQKKDHRCNPILNLFTDPRFQLDAMVPRHTAFVLRVRRLALCVAASLREYGWCVVDHFLGDAHARAIYHETTSLYMTPGLFADGQLMKAAPPNLAGQTPQLASSKDVRSDQIYWFDNRVDRGVHISFLVSMVDSIMYHLTEHIPYRINGRSRAMIACYPGSSTKYVRHVDNPDRDGRCVSTIYYLNENWKRDHGGVLRMYPDSSEQAVDIEPLFDRLLFFWSDRRNPHEVLPAYHNRFAITIWYFDATERAEALAREQHQHHQEEAEKSRKLVKAEPEEKSVTLVDPTIIELRLASEARRRAAPRSASCAELVSVVGNVTGSNSSSSLQMAMQQESISRGSPPGLAQLQQRLRLESPRHSVASTVSTPSSQAAFVEAAMAQIRQNLTQAVANQANQTPNMWNTTTGPTLADYSLLLPPDVMSKLLALSASGNNSGQDQDDKQDAEDGMDIGPTVRSNVTSPGSSVEIDPVTGD